MQPLSLSSYRLVQMHTLPGGMTVSLTTIKMMQVYSVSKKTDICVRQNTS